MARHILHGKMLSMLFLTLLIVLSQGVVLAYQEAPMLTERVKAGELPSVEQRLPKEPLVVQPLEGIGQYGGTLRRVWLGLSDSAGPDRLVTERLLYWTDDGAGVQPNIFKAWDVAEEGRVFTFYMREGMRWSDGAPFTADDIVFWYDDVIGNKELTPAVPAWLVVDGETPILEKLDTYTIRFTFAKPYGLFLQHLAGPSGHSIPNHPKHYLQQFHPKYAPAEELAEKVKAAGFSQWYELFRERMNRWTNVDYPTLSAWILKVPGTSTRMVVERNPYFWQVDPEGNQLPYIDEVTHDMVQNLEVLNLKAIAGEIDFQFRHLLQNNLPMLVEGSERGNYHVRYYIDDFETNMAIGLNLNHKDPVKKVIFGDKRFRIALSHAINRDELNELAYLGLAGEPCQVVPLKGCPYHCEELATAHIEYDPSESNRLLDEMGLTKRDGQGFRLRPDGKRLSITFEFTPAFGPWTQAAELIKSYWDEVGVHTVIKSEERSLFYTRKDAVDHDLGIWTGAAGTTPLLEPRWYLPYSNESIQAVGHAHWYQSGGATGEEPTGDLRRVIDLYEQIKACPDAEEQIRLFHEILEINAENLWVIGTLASPPLVGVVNKDLRNVPEEAVYSWIRHSPRNFWPQQFYFAK